MAIDGEETGDWKWDQLEEEKPGSIESVSIERTNIDEEGYELVRRPRPRILGQFLPEILAVKAEKPEGRRTKGCSQRAKKS